MSGPYRDPGPKLDCPRCGVTLEDSLHGPATCPHCRGVWIPAAITRAAFGDAEWPHGTSMWWHSRLRCPRCRLDDQSGEAPLLAARNVGGTIVDRCARHGVWLDAGELGRVIADGATEAPSDRAALEALQERLRAAGLLGGPAQAERPTPPGAPAPTAAPADTASLTALAAAVTALEDELAERREEVARTFAKLEHARARLSAAVRAQRP